MGAWIRVEGRKGIIDPEHEVWLLIDTKDGRFVLLWALSVRVLLDPGNGAKLGKAEYCSPISDMQN